MGDSSQLLPDDQNPKSQIEDQNLNLIILNIKETNLESGNYDAILTFIYNNKVDLKLIKEPDQKRNDIKTFINKFVEVKDKLKIIELIGKYIEEKGLKEFLYNFLILKSKYPQHKIVTKIITVLSNKTQEVTQANQDYFYEINDRLNNVFRILGEIGNSVFNIKSEQKQYLDDLLKQLETNLENSDFFMNEFPNISKILTPTPSKVAQVEQAKGFNSFLKKYHLLIFQGTTFFVVAITAYFLFFTDILKSTVSETKLDESQLLNALSVKVDNALKLSNKAKNPETTGTQNSVVTVFKQLDEKEITKIKNEVGTVVNDLFNNKKLLIDPTKFDALIKTIENLNTVASPKEEVKGKGEDKKGKENQLKGILPSHKVTLEDKNDIAKITSDSIKSIMEEEFKKITPIRDKSKDNINELAIKEKQITELRISQEILKNDLEAQKKLVVSKDKELLDVTKSIKGFKGPPGSYAILLTNSKDFELTEPILSATLVTVEKQNKESNGVQKLGIYAATGNSIDVKFNLKKGTRGLKPTEMDAANARPTETIAEVGKTFLEFAFDDGKEPMIPINDRKAIIIATWAADAPKDVDGWDKISQVDAILIQTPKANQLREGSAWLDFILKKNGRLLFVQAEEKISGSSSSIGQLQKHLSTLLNTKKD